MELPSTVTAVMAIVSFSFLAAIILGTVSYTHLTLPTTPYV